MDTRHPRSATVSGDLLVERATSRPTTCSRRWRNRSRAARNKLLGEILVERRLLHRGPGRRVPGRRVRRPLRQARARLMDPKIVDVLPREYIEKNLVLPLFVVRGVLTIAVSEPSNLFLIDEIRGLCEPPGPDRRRHAQRHPADDHLAAELEGLRHRRHHRGLRHGRRDADRGGDRGHRRRRGDRRPVAGDPPGQLHHLQRGEGGGQRHPHRAGRALHAGPLPHRRPALQGARSAPAPAQRRDQPHQDHGARWTSASGGCPRTAASSCCWKAARSTSASAPSPPPRARRPSSACSTPGASRSNLDDLGFAEDILGTLPPEHPRPQRHHPRHRPHRQRQVHHALRRA